MDIISDEELDYLLELATSAQTAPTRWQRNLYQKPVLKNPQNSEFDELVSSVKAAHAKKQKWMPQLEADGLMQAYEEQQAQANKLGHKLTRLRQDVVDFFQILRIKAYLKKQKNQPQCHQDEIDTLSDQPQEPATHHEM